MDEAERLALEKKMRDILAKYFRGLPARVAKQVKHGEQFAG